MGYLAEAEVIIKSNLWLNNELLIINKQICITMK